jgi:glycosyltransferase involved in cell wall biosynthesis
VRPLGVLGVLPHLRELGGCFAIAPIDLAKSQQYIFSGTPLQDYASVRGLDQSRLLVHTHDREIATIAVVPGNVPAGTQHISAEFLTVLPQTSHIDYAMAVVAPGKAPEAAFAADHFAFSGWHSIGLAEPGSLTLLLDSPAMGDERLCLANRLGEGATSYADCWATWTGVLFSEGSPPHPEKTKLPENIETATTPIRATSNTVEKLQEVNHFLDVISTNPTTFNKTTTHDQAQAVQKIKLFDAKYYLSMYEDIHLSGVDALAHYMQFGWREHRNPSPFCDTYYMLKANPVREGINPLSQYFDAGRPDNWQIRSPNSVTISALNDHAGPRRKLPFAALKLAVHAHVFYPEFIEEVTNVLKRIRYPFDLFVTTCTEPDLEFISNYLLRRDPRNSFEVRLVENRGRDLGPMLVGVPEIWRNYDVVAHIHSKKSPHTNFGDKWRNYLLSQMFGSSALVDEIMAYLTENRDVGFLFPENLYEIKKYMDGFSNWKLVNSLLKRAGFPTQIKPRIPEFAAGSMAWFRTETFRPLVDSFSSFEDFDLENEEFENTIAHSLERIFPLVATASGYRPVTYYLTGPLQLPPLDRRYSSGTYFESPGSKWARDTPRIAKNSAVPLAPMSDVFDADSLTISWVIPDFDRGAGGHMTIFRIVAYFEELGHRQVVWIQNPANHPTPGAAKKAIQRWYRPIGDNVHVRFLPDDVRQMSGDVIIATDCWTVYPTVAASNFKERFYFIQDFEPYFHPVGENYLVAEQTYRMGLYGLCAGAWLATKARTYSMEASQWELAVDHELYFPSIPAVDTLCDKANRAISIAFYARDYTPRRAKRLGLATFEELLRRGVNFIVRMFGEDSVNESHEFAVESRGIMTPEELAELYRECDIGVVFSTTNYSLVPLEMMACDLPVVDIDTESTRAIFKNGEVTLASPNPVAIADAIQRVIADRDYVNTQRSKAREFVAKLDWEQSARHIDTAIRERLTQKTFVAIRPDAFCGPAVQRRPTVSVVIPTLNAGYKFKAVLERVTQQSIDGAYEVLIIDSGSTDETVDLVRSFKAKNVRLHEIPNEQFQHGRTRNAGISMTDGEYVAILTQDAAPANANWLARLVDGFSLSPRVAGVFGRHLAYPEHGAFVARDLEVMFDSFADYGSLYSWKCGLPSFFHPGGIPWQMVLQFYSDNNSAMRRSVWKILPYPEVDWGEDQLWGWEALKAGFDKAYVDEARVFHSHIPNPQQQFKVSFVEGAFFVRYFGWNLHDSSAQSVESQIKAMNDRDQEFSIERQISQTELKKRMELNRATIRGRTLGAASVARR